MTEPSESRSRRDVDGSDATMNQASAALQALLDAPGERFDAALQLWGCAPPWGEFEIGPGVPVLPPAGSDAAVVFLLWDSADPPGSRWPFKARMLRSPMNGWLVTSIIAQCASCFGSGLVGAGPEPCGTCGAAGWGMLESVEYPLHIGASPLPLAGQVARAS